jgi:hypothetical protein
MRTDTGWVERIPFDLTQVDCGMPWGDWQEQLVMLATRLREAEQRIDAEHERTLIRNKKFLERRLGQ